MLQRNAVMMRSFGHWFGLALCLSESCLSVKIQKDQKQLELRLRLA